MKDITWKYVKPLQDVNVVEEFLTDKGIELPQTLVDCLKENNGGRPSVKVFDTDVRKEYVFKNLLSYNEADVENIYDIYPLFKNSQYYPIGMDSSGNFVCYDLTVRRYILFNHETDDVEIIKFDKKDIY